MDKDIKKIIKETNKHTVSFEITQTQVALVLTALNSFKEFLEKRKEMGNKLGDTFSKSEEEKIKFTYDTTTKVIKTIIDQIAMGDRALGKVLMNIVEEK